MSWEVPPPNFRVQQFDDLDELRRDIKDRRSGHHPDYDDPESEGRDESVSAQRPSWWRRLGRRISGRS